MRTPERILKDRIVSHLKSIGAYYFFPVQTGYGMPTVDILCCVPCMHNGGRVGRFLGIETKAPGKKPTPRQLQCLSEIDKAGGASFWCDNFESYLLNMAVHGLVAPRA